MKQNTKRLYSLIFSMLFVVLALVIYFDMVVPAYTDLQSSKGNLIAEQSLLANEQQVATQIKGLLATYQTQSSDVQAVDAALPVGPHLADAIAQLYGIAQADDVGLQSIGIQEETVQATPGSGDSESGALSGAASTGQVVNPFGTITFSFSVTGSYENINNFLISLEDNMRFFDIGAISIAPVGATGKGAFADSFTATLSATTYYQSQ